MKLECPKFSLETIFYAKSKFTAAYFLSVCIFGLVISAIESKICMLFF